MRAGIYRIARSGAMCLGALSMLLHTSVSAQEAAEFERCAKLEEPQARLECYDAASQRQRATPPADPAAATPVPADPGAPAQAAPLSDAVGEEQLQPKEAVEGPVRGRLTDCREGPTGKWYFYFDNGQVWEQRDSDRLRFRECDFEVTIRKDFFGYKMELPDSDNKIRIARVK
jgi:hypothetical protein